MAKNKDIYPLTTEATISTNNSYIATSEACDVEKLNKNLIDKITMIEQRNAKKVCDDINITAPSIYDTYISPSPNVKKRDDCIEKVKEDCISSVNTIKKEALKKEFNPK